MPRNSRRCRSRTFRNHDDRVKKMVNIDIVNENEFVPEWSVPPGTVLKSVLEERNLRQTELAERTDLTAKHINQIINNI